MSRTIAQYDRKPLDPEFERLTQLKAYNGDVDWLRDSEYPMLHDVTYLDHAGATVYSKSLIETFAADMISNLYGNPHSLSPSSKLSTKKVDEVRLQVLQYFKADPQEFDVVFVSNATAGIKLVAEAFRDNTDYGQHGFWYGYHKDSHNSLVGVREVASAGRQCFESDAKVEDWLNRDASLDGTHSPGGKSRQLGLFAYPGQSNLDGHRLPLDWCRRLRLQRSGVYSLLDAAALLSTSSLDLSNVELAPDFIVMSFYKIFGFPDLGALIVRKESGSVLNSRKYFAGGTVEMVVTIKEQWHYMNTGEYHERLEDGTLPFHSIIALGAAFKNHEKLYKSVDRISSHTSFLSKVLYEKLHALQHRNGRNVCEFYKDPTSIYGDRLSQGATIAFNIRDIKGDLIGKTEVETLAILRNIHLRSGGVCNPGGTASHLNVEPGELRRAYDMGVRCGDDNDFMFGKPTGVIRVSLGAMSNMSDIQSFLRFMIECFVDKAAASISKVLLNEGQDSYFVKRLMIYPIQDCGGFQIPHGTSWDITREGFSFDRQWSIIHLGSGEPLDRKRYPAMAFLHPSIDSRGKTLKVKFYDNSTSPGGNVDEIDIDLSNDLAQLSSRRQLDHSRAFVPRLCFGMATTSIYDSSQISDFFTRALGVPCTLLRAPARKLGGKCRHPWARTQKSLHKSSSIKDKFQRLTLPRCGIKKRTPGKLEAASRPLS